MKNFPPLPAIENAPDELLDGGHLWILELVDGEPLRFRLDESGLIRFGDETRVYDDSNAVPDRYQHAIRYIRENLDREVLRRAVTDVEDITFFGVATHHQTIEYDWERTPSFLGYDVWSSDVDEFRPPDAAEQIFEQLGLRPANAVEKERNTRDFDPDSYTIPHSAWYDGPAKGVVVRNKRGNRGKLSHPTFREKTNVEPADGSAAELAAKFATPRRVETVKSRLSEHNRPVTFESVYERVLEAILREEHARLDQRANDLDMAAFRSELAAVIREDLDG
ncbi:hypothetical protein G3I44_16230 [Halogeometricum borinquense]|uniref:RNA ligase domain-containing protein n=1 Tax=Halogeometricum borinquense TaxID=60847 RepID=A0A6C0UJI1_9EURY|nr:RNA ligase family protein [Halogeometricum borinquense]QIB75694.1 hypothetical protein G3I44_16230 [Halogeometricum borinquense]